MIHQDTYDSLLDWQKAFVQREALSICRGNKAYRHLENIVEDNDHEAAVHADEVLCILLHNAMDEVLEDGEFMDSITIDAEDRYMTRGDNHVR